MSPTVELLWEHGDPGQALTERFGFADARAADRWVAATVQQRWGTTDIRCTRIMISDRNALAWLETPDGPRLAKWSSAPDRFSHLRQVAALIDFESVRYDHRVDELARPAVLLGIRYRDWGPVPAEVHAALFAGYQSVRPLTSDEVCWWDLLRLWYALVFVLSGDDPTGWGAAATQLAAALLPRR